MAAILGAPGPVTTISSTSVRVAWLKSTSAWRSGVTVSAAAATSALPSTTARSSSSRDIGMNTTFTRRCLVFSLALSWSSNSLKDS